MRVAAPGGTVSATRPVVQAILADLPDERVRHFLEAPAPQVRELSAEELGRRGGWRSILIDRLEDESPGVREASESALRRLTNQFFGYRALADAGNRRQAAQRWREWWAVEGRARSARGGREPEG
jgi:hypothetical protein